MANSTAFDWLAQELESTTSLDRLEARGTLRLALKSGGLEPASVSGREMKVVLERIMPAEMEARGIADAERICSSLAGRVGEIGEGGAQPESPADVFARLG